MAAVAAPVDATLSTGKLTISDGFNPIQEWTLNKYKVNLKSDSSPVDLERVTRERAQDQISLGFDVGDYLYLYQVKGTQTSDPGQAAWTYEDANVKVDRVVTFSPVDPFARMSFQIQFKGAKPVPKTAYLTLKTTLVEGDSEHMDQQLAYFSNHEITRQPADKLDPEKTPTGTRVVGPIKWAAALSRYFMVAMIPDGVEAPEAFWRPVAKHSGFISLAYPVTNGKVSIAAKVFFGPKEIELLRSVDPSLDTAVDFGWFTVLAYPILRFMRLLYGFLHNYGLSIILLTFFLKVLTFPLTFKSAKSMSKMAKLQPQIQRLRERHKDNQQLLNQEMMALMKNSGANPMAGCLPMLIQMPVFFALYRVLYHSVELYQAPFALWIHDLSAKDPYYVTPVALTLVMFVQQKLTPSAATVDPAQQKVMQFMPVMFGAMMIALPSGLTLYMLTNAVMSILQQVWMNKKLGLGRYAGVAAAGV